MRVVICGVILAISGCTDESDLGLPCTASSRCNEGFCAMDNLCTASSDLRTVTLTYSCMPAMAHCYAWPRFSTTATGGPECLSHYCANLKYAPLDCTPGATTGETQVLQVPIRFDTVQTMYDPPIAGAGTHDPVLVTTMQIVDDHAQVAVHCEPGV